jgi:integrase
MSKLKKRPDGRYVKTMTDPRTGKRVFFYGQSEREINKQIMEYQSEAERGRSYKKVSEEWWNQTESALAIQSVRTYNAARLRAEEEFGDTPIKDILPKHILAFLKKLANKGYAQKTVSNQRLVINRVFQHAIIANDVQFNACASVETPKGLPKEKRKAACKQDEEFILNLEEIWLFPYIAIMTGMRKGEILALQWKDIDFESNLIYVTKSIAHDDNKPFVKCPKTEAGIRTVPMLKKLRERLLACENRIPDHYIISDDGKSPLTNKRYASLYKRFRLETGVTCTAHQLRHSFATKAYEGDVPAKSLQHIIGHKQISTTLDMYTDFRKKSLDDAAAQLEKTF